MAEIIDSCIFCSKFFFDSFAKSDTVFDTILFKSENFVIVPALGTLVVGYTLILPRLHVPSLANLPLEHLKELSQLKSRITRKYTKKLCAPIFFEHGTVCSTSIVGQCIEHAHLHCVPFNFDLTRYLESKHNMTRIENFTDISVAAKNNFSYMYFESQAGEKFIITDYSVPFQYFRKIIAAKVGIPYEWDWNAFPFAINAKDTVKLLLNEFNE